MSAKYKISIADLLIYLSKSFMLLKSVFESSDYFALRLNRNIMLHKPLFPNALFFNIKLFTAVFCIRNMSNWYRKLFIRPVVINFSFIVNIYMEKGKWDAKIAWQFCYVNLSIIRSRGITNNRKLQARLSCQFYQFH